LRDCAATMPPLEETAGFLICWRLENWSGMSTNFLSFRGRKPATWFVTGGLRTQQYLQNIVRVQRREKSRGLLKCGKLSLL
jgi:hypothetical protein